jgi:hypothetical protein
MCTGFALLSPEGNMQCKSCWTGNVSAFPAEINVHFPGPKNWTKPPVWVFPQLMVCLNCGFTEFRVAEAELQQLIEGTVRSRGMCA